MTVMTMTPFGRQPVTAGLIELARAADARSPLAQADKWDLMRALSIARIRFGLTDRDLAVLNALVSFHPDRKLADNAGLVVFPSNAALSERAHGMAESTLRRHIAALVRAGLILRHDSPNGKRYAARGRDGGVIRAFGFNLRPLLVRAPEVLNAAREVQDEEDARRRLREEVIVLRRDALKLLDFATSEGKAVDVLHDMANELRLGLRRKLDLHGLEALKRLTQRLLSALHAMLIASDSSASDSQNERHHQNSEQDSSESEHHLDRAGIRDAALESPNAAPALPLRLVLRACPDIATFAQGVPRSWAEMVAAAQYLCGMMGVTPDTWREACRNMGAPVAAVTLAAILQAMERIKNPGAYLRTLARKAGQGAFSPVPMVMALLNADES